MGFRIHLYGFDSLEGPKQYFREGGGSPVRPAHASAGRPRGDGKGLLSPEGRQLEPGPSRAVSSK